MSAPSTDVLSLLDAGAGIEAIKAYVPDRIRELEKKALNSANNWEEILGLRGEQTALKALLRLDEHLKDYRQKLALANSAT